MLINKVIFISSLAFKLSISFVLLSLILPRHRSRKISSFRFGSGDFDVLSLVLNSVVLVTDALADFGPSGSIALACACETTCALSDMNSSTSWYQRHFSERSDPDRIFMACLPCTRCRWNSISSCKPRYPLQNPDKGTQASCVAGINCPHVHNVSKN